MSDRQRKGHLLDMLKKKRANKGSGGRSHDSEKGKKKRSSHGSDEDSDGYNGYDYDDDEEEEQDKKEDQVSQDCLIISLLRFPTRTFSKSKRLEIILNNGYIVQTLKMLSKVVLFAYLLARPDRAIIRKSSTVAAILSMFLNITENTKLIIHTPK
jgi:hypothetical protein